MPTLGIPYTLPEIAACSGALDLFQGLPEQAPLRYVAFDTRLIHHGPETVFVAISTGNRDGHDFIPQALALGVRNFILTRPPQERVLNYLLTDHSVDCVQRWAAFHRSRFSVPVVGITGSNGKTIVKEWLATLLELRYQLVKSPLSYNSQLGVPLSVLQMHPQAEVAILEAGISRSGEMGPLAEIIRPTIGIFTHLGAAHAEGFGSEAEKLAEKSRLFDTADLVLAHGYQPEVLRFFSGKKIPIHSIGEGPAHTWQVSPQAGSLRITENGETITLAWPYTTLADLENGLLAIAGARSVGLAWDEIAQRIPLIKPLRMRAELVTDNPEITLLNDAYTADPDSVRHAFATLARIEAHPRRQIILSDLPHLGASQVAVQTQLLAEAEAIAGPSGVWTVGPAFMSIRPFQAYFTTQELFRSIRYDDFIHSTLLLKGARSFELERVIPLLSRRLNAASFQIDLNALASNLRVLKSGLGKQVKVMCMVKAASYGSGTWEIAQALEQEGVDYLAVAYASEGIELRKKGISRPIMVMNPDLTSFELLAQFDLEPEIHSESMLRQWAAAARWAGNLRARFHLKFETGMGRLGIRAGELPGVLAALADHPDLELVSVLSHFAAADEAQHDDFSHAQARRFQEMCEVLHAQGLFPIRHMANTAASVRFPQYQFDMVRLGVGLYGIDPTQGGTGLPLVEIGSLRAPISQIQTYTAGESIGYGRSQRTTRPSRIATLPIGYADGIPRSVSNGKAAALVHGRPAPVFGRVCMDMLMLDVTDIPAAKEGDEAVFFGKQGDARLSVNDLARAADTIAYEILVRISPRVRRVYVRE